MKRLIAIALVLLSFLGLCAQTACAEFFYPAAAAPTAPFDPTARDTFYERTSTQTATRVVTIYTQDISGNFVDPPVQMRLPVATVVNKYDVQVGGDTGEIVGGGFRQVYPEVYPAANARPELEVTAEHVQNYSMSYVAAAQGGQAYEAYCVGGYCTVTYNHVLKYDYYGNLIGKESTTVPLGYQNTVTGTLASLLAENE